MYLKKLSLNYSALSDRYERLDEKYKELRRDCTLELREKDIQIDQLSIKLDREIDRKKKWRRVALVEGGIITAIVLILVL
jgi:predicted metalloenzyme YecM